LKKMKDSQEKYNKTISKDFNKFTINLGKSLKSALAKILLIKV